MLSELVAVLFVVAVAAFPVSEILLAIFKRAKANEAVAADRGSMRLLWIAIGAGLVGGNMVQAVRAGRLPVRDAVAFAIAFSLIVLGLLVRWISILTLGRLFTVDVAIHPDHALVDTGLYRHVRHPSYAGLLLAFLGVGVSFRNGLSILVLIVPIALAIANRIRKEEAALRAALGDGYAIYCRRTKRLVPGVF